MLSCCHDYGSQQPFIPPRLLVPGLIPVIHSRGLGSVDSALCLCYPLCIHASVCADRPRTSQNTPPIESGGSRGICAPIRSTSPVGYGSQGSLYTPAGQSIPLCVPGGWMAQDGPLPNSPSTYHFPPLIPTTSSSVTLQPVTPNRLPLPQRPYALTVHHFTPAHPILFNVDSGEPGIRLSAALNRRFTHLRDRDDLVFESSRSPTITMRLEVCGFSESG